jgi:hypothetical protein
MILKKTSFLLVLLALFTPCSFAVAQSIPGIQDPIVVRVTPTNPRSNEPIIIDIQSYATDLNTALVSWSVDGKEEANGVGLKRFRMTAGPLGSTKTVEVSVGTLGSGVLSTTIIIRPADVGLLWEADTYTPPFYQGKALHSFNGTFKVIALPELYASSGEKIDAKDLIYTWSKNGEVQGSASGYGRNTFVGSQTSYLREGEDISVEVSAPRENVVASNNILVIPTVPEILFYENSPLYGIVYEKALQNSFKLTNEEISIIAEPMFFSVGTRGSSRLTYDWTLNKGALSDFKNKSEVTLRRANNQAGRANVEVVSQHQQRLLQGGKGALTISYE